MSPWQQQLRLNINRFTAVVDDSSPPSASNPVRFRELTPHPTLTQWNSGGGGSTAIMTTSPGGSFHADSQNFQSSPALQEYWARRDRQMLARDIYVMLYLFGGGQDVDSTAVPLNYAATSNGITSAGPPVQRPLYQDWQLAEMAQFAVNYVDALDRDDTITMFEYDKNLADGWNLDDNAFGPTSNDGTTTDRGFVFGVETQQLAFSEVLVIVSRMVKSYLPPNTPKDHLATQLDDSKTDRTFTYLELHNVSPYPVPVNNLNWQVALVSPGTVGVPNPSPQLPLSNPSQTITSSTMAAASKTTVYTMVTLNDFNNRTIAAGQTYTIGSRNYIAGTDDLNGKPYASTFVVDPNWSSALANPDPALGPPAHPVAPRLPQPTAACHFDGNLQTSTLLHRPFRAAPPARPTNPSC